MSDASVLLGFDYGEKRIGVAIANSLTRQARPLQVIENRSRDYRFQTIAGLIESWRPATLIVGLPVHPDGNPHAMTQLARRFGNQMTGRFALPVIWVDERYSSVDARAQRADDDTGRRSPPGRSGPARRAVIDDEAARIILQQYLDSQTA